MVFPAAIREKSQRGVAHSCDAHVMSAKSGGIRQPCTEYLLNGFCENFFNRSAFLRGKLNLEGSVLINPKKSVLVELLSKPLPSGA